MTDENVADKVYIEPLDVNMLEDIIQKNPYYKDKATCLTKRQSLEMGI